METILSVKNLTFGYDTNKVLVDVTFSVNKGDYLALAGPNGAGKTTLVKVILGLEDKQQGKVKIFGKDLESFDEWHRVGYLPQRVNVFNPLFPATVKEVVGLGRLAHKRYPRKFNKEDEANIRKTLELMGVFELKDKLIGDLSGGQQQRVFLARALISNPDLIILDEPSTALDPETRENFFQLVKKLNKEKGVTIIIITHDTSHIGQYANQLLYLDKRIIFYGPFSDFCQSEEMEKYFGRYAQHLICHQHQLK